MAKEYKDTEHDDALIFIPDISGFTNFVTNTEILHARHIITELLETIIDSNEIGLEVSEIEGDAVLFYRFGSVPTLKELLDQAEKMYINFKAHLKKYENQRVCQCGACASAEKLSLKIVAHYGEVVLESVKDHQKLFGTDVIVAHRLLKNDLRNKQYLILTEQMMNSGNSLEDLKAESWSEPEMEQSEYDFGKIRYYHLPLDVLDDRIPEPELVDFSIPGVTMKIDEYVGTINAPIKMVFDVVSDLAFRHIWMEALKDSDMLNSRITNNGATHRCVINGDKSDPLFFTHDFKKENSTLRFTESDHRKKVSNIFSFESLDENRTRLSIHSFIKPSYLKKWIFQLLLKRKYHKFNDQNYVNLNAYCSRLISEGRQHESGIIL